ncbi:MULTISPECIES: 16S rRNA (guanine(527)-N(7))-methyltransferase RsmG [Kordiimonas]|jgi:16S rRNA (guanine527-N7)-methyltransferase|uniref:Ribosomal RNA small subunit methyltransferase G n=1 Tax=Kordiimonas lacus TaxID=637679 RepID=A0A1G6TMF8_9PROT|nr:MULTISPECIES: 16S rRNA (guanine(527)-N(7))-methyltransferase RsmG [Kordiimonas]SDD30273.1 16S rRNA (guanine527-N7)-methyltransferase [Kordiimonas lacus]
MYGADDLARDLDVSRETLDKLKVYAGLLAKWQKAKNLVANSTLDDMWRRHFLDSAQLAPLLKERFGDREVTLLDIGSGAGFPGLVLSAMGVATAHMVESNGRKCTFMNQVSRETGANATIHAQRIEEMDIFPVDIVTSRACARISQLLDWAAPFLNEDTEMWLLKGEIADEELTEAKACWKMNVDRFKSLSDPTGVILRLSSIKRL